MEHEVVLITFTENKMRKIEKKYIIKNINLRKYYLHIYNLSVKKFYGFNKVKKVKKFTVVLFTKLFTI